MKRLFFILSGLVALLVLGCAGRGQEPKAERQQAPERKEWSNNIHFFDENYVVYGDVESVSIVKLKYKGENTYDEQPMCQITFNERGDVVRFDRYGSYVYEFAYDARANKVEERQFERGELTSQLTYEYDSKDHLVNEVGYYYNMQCNYSHIYDDNGNEVEYINYSDAFRQKYVYNAANQLVESNAYSLDGKEHRVAEISEYDANGNLVSITYKSVLANSIWRKDTFVYDDNNHKVEYNIFSYNDDGSVERSVERFNEYGDLIEELDYNADGTLDSRKVYEYDDRGSLVDEKRYDGEGNVEKHYVYHLEYDAQGNRISSEKRRIIDANSWAVEELLRYDIVYR
jgi:hypothetical protein